MVDSGAGGLYLRALCGLAVLQWMRHCSIMILASASV
jgi:hypothetical protein